SFPYRAGAGAGQRSHGFLLPLWGRGASLVRDGASGRIYQRNDYGRRTGAGRRRPVRAAAHHGVPLHSFAAFPSEMHDASGRASSQVLTFPDMTSHAATPRLKIAFVVDRFGNRYGGAEAYGVELMRELAQRHDVTVFGREYDPDCNLTLPFISLLPPRGIPSWLRALVFALRARRAV